MYLCCEMEFEGKEEYLCHLELDHEGATRLKCAFAGCRRKFSNPRLLKRHVLTHQDKFNHARYISKLQKNSGDFSEPAEAYTASFSLLLSEFSEMITRRLSALYAAPYFTRGLVARIVQISQEMAVSCDVVGHSERLCKSLSRRPMPRQELMLISKWLERKWQPFVGLETEDLREDWFYDMGTLILYNEVAVGEQRCAEFAEVCVFELEPMLRYFFQKPGVLDKVKHNMAACELIRGYSYTSFLQGELWQRKKALFPGKVVIPLTLYVGDFNIMKRTTKVGVVYLNIPALPDEMRSLLDFVFVAGLHYSVDRKDEFIGIEGVLDPILTQLQKLHDQGLKLRVDNAWVKVYFCVTYVQADNLMLDELLALPTTNACRFCTADEHLRTTMVRDDGALLRVKSKKQSKLHFYGLSFKNTDNWYMDVVNDFLLEVCKLDLVHILPDLIFVQNLISVDELNQRLLTFNYASQDRRHSPPTFSTFDLKNGNLRMDAGQIECLIRNLPLIMADLILQGLDTEDKVQLLSWKLFMAMRDVLYLLLAKTLKPGAEGRLRDLVDAHHTLFKQFAPYNGTLPPAFHNATHYWRVIRELGPPNVQEARPKVSSEHCYRCKDREERLSAIAWKHQMILNDRLLMKNYTIVDELKVPKTQTDVSPEILQEFCIAEQADSWKCVLKINCLGEYFKVGSLVVVDVEERVYPKFCRVEHILVQKSPPDFKLLCVELKTDYYDDRLGAFCVSEIMPKQTRVVPCNGFIWRRCFYAYPILNKMFVTLHANLHV